MSYSSLQKPISFFIAFVWLINGVICKILNLVPRHRQIIGRILGEDHALLLSILIGFSEVIMSIWILTGILRRFNAIAQIAIIATMNIMEFILVPDLLLWGKFNSVFAFMFITMIYINEFILNKKYSQLT